MLFVSCILYAFTSWTRSRSHTPTIHRFISFSQLKTPGAAWSVGDFVSPVSNSMSNTKRAKWIPKKISKGVLVLLLERYLMKKETKFPSFYSTKLKFIPSSIDPQMKLDLSPSNSTRLTSCTQRWTNYSHKLQILDRSEFRKSFKRNGNIHLAPKYAASITKGVVWFWNQ